jgi:Family of unknown function (DUF6949)
MQGFFIILFSITAGFTASGITANLYRLAGFTSETRVGRIFRGLILVIAGPSVILENAVRSRINKECSAMAFGLVACVVIYWSLGLGLFALQIATLM